MYRKLASKLRLWKSGGLSVRLLNALNVEFFACAIKNLLGTTTILIRPNVSAMFINIFRINWEILFTNNTVNRRVDVSGLNTTYAAILHTIKSRINNPQLPLRPI